MLLYEVNRVPTIPVLGVAGRRIANSRHGLVWLRLFTADKCLFDYIVIEMTQLCCCENMHCEALTG